MVFPVHSPAYTVSLFTKKTEKEPQKNRGKLEHLELDRLKTTQNRTVIPRKFIYICV